MERGAHPARSVCTSGRSKRPEALPSRRPRDASRPKPSTCQIGRVFHGKNRVPTAFAVWAQLRTGEGVNGDRALSIWRGLGRMALGQVVVGKPTCLGV